MPPVGLGVNLAMLDAADLATAINHSVDWRCALRDAEILVSARAKSFMRDVTKGFEQWFDDAPETFAYAKSTD
jgi:hypothetical protein